MQTVTTIGLDIAKSVFQVHGVDANGLAVIRRQLKRRYVLAFFQKVPFCLIGIQACASSHFWARELRALGHIPRLMTTPTKFQRKRRLFPILLRGLSTVEDLRFSALLRQIERSRGNGTIERNAGGERRCRQACKTHSFREPGMA